MANLTAIQLPVYITGDGVSLTAVVDLANTSYTLSGIQNLNSHPTAAAAVASYDHLGADVSANISSVVVSGSQVTITFVAPFTGLAQVILSVSYPVDGSALTTPVSSATQAVGTNLHAVLDAGAAVIGHVISDSGSVVNATLSPETTKIIGTVRVEGNVGGVFDAVIGSPTPTDAVQIGVSDGVNLQTLRIKAASTAPVVTDPALVVTLSPNAGLGTTATPMVVSLGDTSTKAVVMKTGKLVTTTTTAGQVVLTYTVTALKTFYLEYLSILAVETLIPGNSNPVAMGEASLESPAGTALINGSFISPADVPLVVPFSEPIPFAAGTVIRVVCTPAATTSASWYANFGGYER